MGKTMKNNDSFLSKHTHKPLHPHSRKAAALSKKVHRENRMDKQRGQKNMRLQILAVRLSFFKENFDPTLTECNRKYLHQLVMKYLDRSDAEVQEMEAKKKQYSNSSRFDARIDKINFTKKTEKAQYNSTGFEMADLFDGDTFKRFKEWEGDIKVLPSMKFRKFVKSFLTAK